MRYAVKEQLRDDECAKTFYKVIKWADYKGLRNSIHFFKAQLSLQSARLFC